MFLFGAGASFGAATDTIERPPLGDSLFEQLSVEYCDSWRLIDKSFFSDGDGVRFEEGLYSYLLTESRMLVPLQKDLAMFFSKYKIINKENKLIQLIEKNRTLFDNNNVVLSTINYDLLLEYALSMFQIKFTYSPNIDEFIKVLKLHGSCNFISKSPRLTLKKEINMPATVNEKGELEFGQVIGEFHILWNMDELKGALEPNSSFPIMALYTKTKNVLFNKKVIQEIQEGFESILRQCEMVFVIGIRQLDYDSHIWNPLKSYEKQLFLIGNEKELDKWKYDNNLNNAKVIDRTDNYWDFINQTLSDFEL